MGRLGNATVEILTKRSKRLNTIAGEAFDDLTFLPYELLKHEIPNLVKQAKFEQVIFEIVRLRRNTVTLQEIEQLDNHDKLMFVFWVNDQYQLIANLEQQYLSTPPDPKLVNAGIKDLDVLGDVNLIDSLAGGDILKWEAVRNLPYAMIFDKQLKTTIENRINKKLAKQKK